MKSFSFALLFLIISFSSFAQTNSSDSLIVVSGPGALGHYTQNDSQPKDLYAKGQFDASTHYKKYKGAATGTLITSLISPLVGLIPAIACSATTPKMENLGYPDQNLFLQREYQDSYTRKAKKIKSGKVWKNWGIGFGVNLVAVLLLSASK